MERGLIPKRPQRPFPPLPCSKGAYPVLAPLSKCYPGLGGRLSTRYSPVRRWAPYTSIWCPARLACVKHAASVRPEPGSNSPISLLKAFSGSSFCLFLPFRTVQLSRTRNIKTLWLEVSFLTISVNTPELQCYHIHIGLSNNISDYFFEISTFPEGAKLIYHNWASRVNRYSPVSVRILALMITTWFTYVVAYLAIDPHLKLLRSIFSLYRD